MVQSLPLLLTGLMLLAPSGDKPRDAQFDAEAILSRVAAMEPARQKQWRGQLALRLDRANSVLMKSADAAKKKAAYAAILEQEPLPPSALKELVEETDTREKAAIAQLARQYRIQVYETFWKKQDLYRPRQEALTRAMAAWEVSGRQFQQQEQMVIWLQEALRSVVPDSAGPVPDDPSFDDDDKTKKSPPARARHAEPRPSEPQSGVSRGYHSAGIGGLSYVAAPEEDLPRRGAPQWVPALRALPVEFGSPAASDGRDARAAGDLRPLGRQPLTPCGTDWPEADLALCEAPPTAVETEARSPSLVSFGPTHLDFEAVAAEVEHRMDGSLLPERATQPVGLEAADDPTLLLPLAVVSRQAAQRGTVPFSSDENWDSRQVRENRAGRGTVPFSSDENRDSPRVRENWDSPQVGSRPLAPPPGDEALPAMQVADEPPVAVNVADLQARIGGYNLTLQAIETELDAPHEWSAARLVSPLERLRDLVRQKGDLATFRDLLEQWQRASVGVLDSPKAVIALLGRRIFEARTRASGADFLGTQADRQAEIDQLDALSRALAELAPEK